MSVQNRGFGGVVAEVEGNRAIRSSLVCRGEGYGVSATTGTIAAALAANSSIFSMRLDPGAGARLSFIERVRLQFTCLTAFTVPITAGRRLELYRAAASAHPSGGTGIAVPPPKNTNYANSEFSTAQGGDLRIATTAALTMTGSTFEAAPLRGMSLSHVGAAGAFFEEVFEFSAGESEPIALLPGQLLAVRNPVAMDAAGTFQVTISVDWHEAAALI